MLANASQGALNRSLLHFNNGTAFRQGCRVIIAGNASWATNWENIPETLLLNGSIGIILFIIFIILTYIAWQRADSDDTLKSLNIVTFLYGYRDPEQWYIIPRFEFLRREERHHQHDLNYPHLYVPPKLPLANPLEIFANNDNIDLEKSKSIESAQEKPSFDLLKKPIDSFVNNAQKATKSGVNDQKGKQDPKAKSGSKGSRHDLLAISPTSPEATKTIKTHHLPNQAINQKQVVHKSAASFFFPSILTAEQLQASSISRKLNKFFSIFFRVSDADIIYARGIDAYEYLLFQRHLILILIITNVLCVGIILPIHWFGGVADDSSKLIITSFQRTTIKNLATDAAHLHWAHIFCSLVIVACALRIMGSYRDSIITTNEIQLSRRTLLIGNIPVEQRSRSHLLKILMEHFPRLTIEAIQFVYDTASLVNDEMYLSSTIVAKDYCLAYKRRYNKEIYIHRTDVNTGRHCNGNCRCCSFLYICCCYWPCESSEPGSVYYAKEEQFYRERIAKKCEKLFEEPAEFAFVTFKSNRQARRVLKVLANMKSEVLEGKGKSQAHSAEQLPSAMSSNRPKTAPPASSKFFRTSNKASNDPLDPKNDPHIRSIRSPGIQKIEKKLESNQKLAASNEVSSNIDSQASGLHSRIGDGPLMWSVRYAPHPDNIDFQDLLNLSRTSPFTIVLMHTLMIIIFIFITTPNVILSMLERMSVLRPDQTIKLTGFQALIINYISIMLQIITTAVLPALITLISKQIPYEDSSTKGHSVMWKVYLFLVLMVIVMPSIGMSSALAVLDSGVEPRCLFPTDNGAYYINYVISSIFLSTILELIKPSDILSYYFILWTSRSTAEIEGGRQFIEREFSVGLQHTTVLLIFSVVMTYSISCPLIAPAGLCYMIVKHSVDHYNLYYSYFTKKVDKDMQSTVVIFVKVALLLMLFQTTVAIYSRTGTGYFSLIAQMIFWITLAAFIFNCFYDCTSRSLPPAKVKTKFQHDFCACFYLPNVISSLLRASAIPADCISRKV